MLKLDRYQEELRRLDSEGDNLCRWFGQEISALEVAIATPAGISPSHVWAGALMNLTVITDSDDDNTPLVAPAPVTKTKRSTTSTADLEPDDSDPDGVNAIDPPRC